MNADSFQEARELVHEAARQFYLQGGRWAELQQEIAQEKALRPGDERRMKIARHERDEEPYRY